jgi:hypothetical protein
LSLLRPGDLVLRDLGYFTFESLRGIGQAGAYFVSRLSSIDGLLTADGTDCTLGAILSAQPHAAPGTCIDKPILLGKEARLPVRLVAIKLNAATAAERRRKALANRDKRCKPTAESLSLLDWAVYVTNLPQESFSAHKVASHYRLRWRVEIVFKSFKSAGLRLNPLLEGRKSPIAVEVFTYATLILALFGARMTVGPKQTPPQSQAHTPRSKGKNRSTLKCATLLGLFHPLLLLEWFIPE